MTPKAKKKSDDRFVIKTDKDFLLLLDNIDNPEFIYGKSISSGNISVKIKLEGNDFESSLTGKVIGGLAEYQQRIYHAYKVQKYGARSNIALTDAELEMLEIKVSVKPGCTEAIVALINNIPEVVKQMSGEDIKIISTTVVAIISTAWAIKSITSVAIKEKFKTKRAEIDIKMKEADTDEKKAFYEMIRAITHDSIESVRSVAASVVSRGTERITIDDKEISKTELSLIPQEMAPPRKPIDKTDRMYNVEGMFRVLNLNYEGAVTMMKAQHIASEIIYEDVSLQNDWLNETSMDAIKNAENREPIFFKINIHEVGKKSTKAIDVNSIDPERTE